MNSFQTTKRQILRVAILGTRGIPARYGGFETFAEQLSLRLVERGHYVTVYAESTSGKISDAVYHDVQVRNMPVPCWGALSVIGFDIRCLWDARQRFDLVYMLGYGAAFACWIPRLFQTPVWINIDGLEWARSKWSASARAYLRTMEWVTSKVATRVIADAQAMVMHFQQCYGTRTPCTYVAYGAPRIDYASDADALTRRGLILGAYLLVVARIEPENHVLEIIKGVQDSGTSLPLVVVGDHLRPTRYCRMLMESDLRGVQLLGGIFDSELLQQLRLGACAYIHGHSVGGTNPSLLEAMGCGNVVLAHDNPFNREVLGEVGLYFSSAAGLAVVLRRFFQLGESERQDRSKRAREIIDTRYTWDLIAGQYESLMLSDAPQTRSSSVGHKTGLP